MEGCGFANPVTSSRRALCRLWGHTPLRLSLHPDAWLRTSAKQSQQLAHGNASSAPCGEMPQIAISAIPATACRDVRGCQGRTVRLRTDLVRATSSAASSSTPAGRPQTKTSRVSLWSRATRRPGHGVCESLSEIFCYVVLLYYCRLRLSVCL